jgi:hypothetical protein
MQPTLLIGLSYGVVYGGVAGFLRDAYLTWGTPIYPHPVYTVSEFYMSSGFGAFMYGLFFPAFRYTFMMDAARDTHPSWKLSIHTYLFVSVLYPFFIFLWTESVYRFDDKNADLFLSRLCVQLPMSGILTMCLEASGLHDSLRRLYYTF